MAGWYPSHMAKARRALKENLRLVDVVIEIVDARIPKTSRIPDFDELRGNKASVVALNKADLADPKSTSAWLSHFRSRPGSYSCSVNASTGDGIGTLFSLAHDAAEAAFTGAKRLRPFRAMAVGIPNVGKSSLLNRLAGKKSARTGDRPGITRGKQWLRVAEDLELLDLPGILWPQQSQSHEFTLLCVTGAVPDDAYDMPSAASFLLDFLRQKSPGAIEKRYGFDESGDVLEVLTGIAQRRGFLGSGGTPDLSKASMALIMDFRQAKLGRFSLEAPEGADHQ